MNHADPRPGGTGEPGNQETKDRRRPTVGGLILLLSGVPLLVHSVLFMVRYFAPGHPPHVASTDCPRTWPPVSCLELLPGYLNWTMFLPVIAMLTLMAVAGLVWLTGHRERRVTATPEET